MRSNQNYSNATDPNQLKNYQKLDYDLWHHATLASYFKALNKHTAKLSITIVRLCGNNFNVDSRSFEQLIDLLDNLPVQLKRTMTDQLNFQLSSLDDETLKLSFTSSFGYYLQTLITLAPEDEVKQNIDTLLKLRTSIAELPTSQATNAQVAEDPEEDTSTDESVNDDLDTSDGNDTDTESTASDAPYSQRIGDNPMDVRYDNPTETATQDANAYQEPNDATQSSEGSSTDTQGEYNASAAPVNEQQSEGTAVSIDGVANGQAEPTAPETAPEPEAPATSSEPESDTNDNGSVNPTDDTTDADDDDDEFADMYDDDPSSPTDTVADTNSDINANNEAAINAVQNNEAGDVIDDSPVDDSPVDYGKTVGQLTDIIGSALSSGSNKQEKSNRLDEFYREQDRLIANKLTALN